MGLDPRDVPSVRPEELQRREEALALDVAAALEIRANSNLVKLVVTDYTTLPLNGVDYARLIFAAGGLANRLEVIEINAAAVFRVDTNMHGLLRLEHAGRVDAVAFNRERPAHQFRLVGGEGRLDRWLTFIWEGVWHIWIGFDHILFLIALLLPAVLVREKDRWRGVDSFRAALMNVLKIVTAFTVAHSITLSLAAMGVVSLPSRLVESVIAASVALDAAGGGHAHHAVGWTRPEGLSLPQRRRAQRRRRRSAVPDALSQIVRPKIRSAIQTMAIRITSAEP